VDECKPLIAGQIRRLGASCDWSRERFTLDDGLSDAVLEAFVSLHDKGQGLTLVHFSAQPKPFWPHLPAFPCLIDWGNHAPNVSNEMCLR